MNQHFPSPSRTLALLGGLLASLPAVDQVAFTSGSRYAMEANATVQVSLVRSGDLAGTASVDVGVNTFGFVYGYSPAVSGTDHNFSGPVTATFAAGQSLATVSIPLLDDNVSDGNRFLALNLTNPVNAAIGTSAPGTNSTTSVNIIDDEPVRSLIINPSDPYSIYAGESIGTLAIPVRRVGPLTGSVTASWTIGDSSNRFSPDSGTLSWADGQGGYQYAQVAITNDTAVNSTRGEILSLTYQVAGSTVNSSATIYLGDDEGWPGGFITPVSYDTAAVVERDTPTTVNIPLQRVKGFSGAVTVSVALGGGPSTDASLLTPTVSWADGEGGIKPIQVQVLPDDVAESREDFFLSLTIPVDVPVAFSLNSGVPQRTTTVSGFSIPANDQPALGGRIGFTASQWAVVEGGTATIAVERFGDLAGAASATFTFTNSSTSNTDWSATPATGTLNWAAGEGGIRTVAFTAIQDTETEATELLRLTLSSLTGAVLAGSNKVDIAIYDNDFVSQPDRAERSRIELDYPASVLYANEGSPLVVALKRSGDASQAVSLVVVSEPGSALSSSDYTAAEVTVSWAAGETGTKSATFASINDTVGEPSESFTARLSAPIGWGYLVGSDSVTLSIGDDDSAGNTYEFTIAGVAVNENDPTVTGTVTRHAGGSGAVSLIWALLVAPDPNYPSFPAYGVDVTGTFSGILAWADGETGDKTFNLQLLDDTVADGDKNFRVFLTAASGQPVDIQPFTDLRVLDNEPSAGGLDVVGVLATSTTSIRLTEGADHLLTFRRRGLNNGAITLRVGSDSGTATPGLDYTLSADAVVWAAGDLSDKTLTLSVLADTDVLEGDESLSVRFFVNEGNAYAGGYTQYVDGVFSYAISANFQALIDEAASSAGDIIATSTRVQFTEGVDPNLTVTLGRLNGTAGAVVVSYATVVSQVGDFARQGSDFTPVSGTLSWADGEAGEKTISIPLIDDALVEFDEVVRLLTAQTSGSARLVTPGWLFTIRDNDVPSVNPGFMFAGSAASLAETDPALAVTVQRVGTTGTASVGIAISGTATIPADAAVSTTSLAFSDGQASGTVTITPVDDGAGDSGETVILTLVSPSAGALILTPSVFTVTLTEVTDTTAPTVAIATVNGTAPTAGAITVRNRTANVVINATDNVAVTSVTWTRGGLTGSASASGLTWTITGLPLEVGANTVVVTAKDAANNQAAATVVITVQPAQTFTPSGTLTNGAGAAVDITPALLGLGAGDLSRYDAATNTFIPVGANEVLTPGIRYVLAPGVAAPAFPPAGHTVTPTPAGRVAAVGSGWSLRSVSGGAAVTWDPATVQVILDGTTTITLDQAITAGHLRPYIWAYDPATGSISLVTRDPSRVPGSTATIPAGATLWVRSFYVGSLEIRFPAAAPTNRG